MTTNTNIPRNRQVDCTSIQMDAGGHDVQITADDTQTRVGQQDGSTAGCTIRATEIVQQLVPRKTAPQDLAFDHERKTMMVTSITGRIVPTMRRLPSELDHWDCDTPVWTHYHQQKRRTG